MDLAKIRQKASLEASQARMQEVAAEEVLQIQPHTPFVGSMSDESGDLSRPLQQEEEFFTQPSSLNQATIVNTVPSPQRDPLQIILEGRTAAGCDDDAFLSESPLQETVRNDYLEYLCFRVSNELYGINIMDIKEIIKPREVTEVPRAPVFVSGVISLRGIIIPIIDMLNRLGLHRSSVTGRERVIVVKNNESFCGLMVDEIIQVVRIPNDCVEAAPAVLEGIDRDFVNGIGRADGRMIIILNLENVADIDLV